jgi:hypothetical protein
MRLHGKMIDHINKFQQLASSPTSSSSFMSLISPKDIAELTQVATQFAAQTFKTNGDLM